MIDNLDQIILHRRQNLLQFLFSAVMIYFVEEYKNNANLTKIKEISLPETYLYRNAEIPTSCISRLFDRHHPTHKNKHIVKSAFSATFLIVKRLPIKVFFINFVQL